MNARLRSGLWSLAVAVLVAASASCRRNESISFRQVDDERGWLYGDTLLFHDLAVPDTAPGHPVTGPGRLSVALRHTNGYLYSNIWLEVGYRTVDSIAHTDTVGIELCDVYGRWYGKGIATLYQIERPVADNVTLLPGSDVSVRHVMRVDTLRGVGDVGVSYVISERKQP